ncbi:UNVERIFIED_CONTAM: hypothetical protein FKN15_058427 [Acipenser sinensis]
MDNSSRSRKVKYRCPRSQFSSPTKYRRSSAGTPQPSCWSSGEEDCEDEARGTPLNISSYSALLESMHTICLETPKCETAVSSIHNQQSAQGGEDSRSSLKSCSVLRKTSFRPQTPTKVTSPQFSKDDLKVIYFEAISQQSVVLKGQESSDGADRSDVDGPVTVVTFSQDEDCVTSSLKKRKYDVSQTESKNSIANLQTISVSVY